MKIRHYFTCLVDASIAGYYIHYCDTHDISYEAIADGTQVYIEICGTQEEIKLFNKWILKALYYQEAQHG